MPYMPKVKRRSEPKAVVMLSPLRSPSAPWAFRLYIGQSGRNRLQDWSERLSVKARAKRDSTMKFLRVQPEQRWSRPQASPLGNHVYVIRFTDETGKQHRLFGYFALEHHAFVICLAGFEKDGRYQPKDYEERTKQCRVEVDPDCLGRTVECPWPVE